MSLFFNKGKKQLDTTLCIRTYIEIIFYNCKNKNHRLSPLCCFLLLDNHTSHSPSKYPRQLETTNKDIGLLSSRFLDKNVLYITFIYIIKCAQEARVNPGILNLLIIIIFILYRKHAYFVSLYI